MQDFLHYQAFNFCEFNTLTSFWFQIYLKNVKKKESNVYLLLRC